MTLKEFYKKYAKVPDDKKHIVTNMVKGNPLGYSPAELHHAICDYEWQIKEAKQQLALRLKWADVVLK
jgi:hypothetical protein